MSISAKASGGICKPKGSYWDRIRSESLVSFVSITCILLSICYTVGLSNAIAQSVLALVDLPMQGLSTIVYHISRPRYYVSLHA